MKNSSVVMVLERIQIDNFVSHNNTVLKLGPGITVFIGRNGSGKSSIIDAITFALYGEHTRGHNRNLVRRGSEGTVIQLNFRVDSKRYQATRRLDAKGSLVGAKLEQITSTGYEAIAHGERRQMGETMSAEASNIIGLDYDRLRVAAVVQQGELDAILNNKPSEFKELINVLIGIDRLDRAYQKMKDVIDAFRLQLKQRTGYDDQDIDNVKHNIAEANEVMKESSMKLEELNLQLKEVREEEKNVKKKLDVLEPLSRKVKELEESEDLLARYVRQELDRRKKELERLEQLVKDAMKNIEDASRASRVRDALREIREEIRKLELNIQKRDSEAGRLDGLLECAVKYLQPVDGKCPVCGSAVGDLNIELNVDHVKDDLERIREDLKKDKAQMSRLKQEESRLVNQDIAARSAVQFLASVGIENADDISKKEAETQKTRDDLTRISNTDLDEPERFVIDEYSHELADKILSMKKELKAFDPGQHQDLRSRYDKLVNVEIPSLSREIGRFESVNKQARADLESLGKALQELENAHSFIILLEKIRRGVYNRDGSVAMSLRSWALKMISQKASDYIAMFALNLLRVELAEKARDVLVTCYGPRGSIDLESLSGGEKVAVALALRLGMAYVMGRGKLDFIILDEPTTHLDEERRQSLVRIITEAFRAGLGILSQIIIITHDAEIFEDANVDSIYKFMMTAEGTIVTSL